LVKRAFIITCSFILGALAVEYKQYFTHEIPAPIAELPDGGVYKGELRKGLLSGKGRITWPGNSYYEGDFVDGLYHGKGVLHTPDYLYDGDFSLGIAKGEGTIDFVNGDKYNGEVSFTRPDGSGVLETADGRIYTGGFEAGFFHGQGELKDELGGIYVGAFDKGLFEGDGVYTQFAKAESGEKAEPKIEAIYSGKFVKGQFTGEGGWMSSDRRYEGEFLDWQFHGEGLYSDSDGTYSGDFVAGVYEGVGTYTSVNGAIYKGDFSAGRYHGQGHLITDRGDSYRGEFQYGLQHGEGKLEYAEALDGIDTVKGVWQYDRLVKANHPRLAISDQRLAEHALYHQKALLEKEWSTLLVQNPEKIDLYFVGIAGDGTQEVFRREVGFVKTLFDENYATKGRSVSLINSPFSYDEKPLATVTSIQQTLEAVAAKMDVKNDILFLYLTSHGSRDFKLQLSQPGLALEALSADTLGEILKALPVKHKVVMVSSCFSGGFVTKIKDDNMLVVTASEADKTSFGCHDRAKMTYFGEAFFKDALLRSSSFVDAFYRARDIVRGREAKEGFEYSNPLIFKPKAIVEKLQAWRAQFKEETQKNALVPRTSVEQ
jgi:hypothetical protein